MSAEGQSRIHFRQNRHLVRFESVHLSETAQWFVGMEIPGRGQEVVQANYSQTTEVGQPHIMGRFYQRLLNEAERDSNPQVKVWLDEFVDLLIFIPRLIDSISGENEEFGELTCDDEACQLADRKFYYQITRHGIELITPSSRPGLNLSFALSELHESGEWFVRMRFRLNLAGRVGPEAHPAELYLFLTECKDNRIKGIN